MGEDERAPAVHGRTTGDFGKGHSLSRTRRHAKEGAAMAAPPLTLYALDSRLLVRPEIH
jgi:hypothetical protein